jgi:DNA-binding NtrC family response regulator
MNSRADIAPVRVSGMKPQAGTILICDDEAGFRDMIASVLGEEGHQVLMASSLASARELLASSAPDLLLLDLRLPDGDGLKLLEEQRVLGAGCLCLVMTAHASLRSAVEALRLGAHDYLEKPVQFEDLIAKVNLLLRHQAALRENALLRSMVATTRVRGRLDADCPSMSPLTEQALKVAARGRVALLTGESGAGKEVLARFIHDNGPDCDGPFVPVNLAAMPDSVAEAQLFGHVRGAFTGADRTFQGLARAATGGTLFLDEITETSPALQAKLLRLVDRSEVLPVGATQQVRVQCRLLAATNRDVPTEVAAGRFRDDLYHRLNVVQLHVPSLRERRDGIPALSRAILESLAQDRGMPCPAVAPMAMRALTAYHWPGNVRELRNVLERALILGKGAELEASDLPEELWALAPDDDEAPDDLRRAVTTFERALIQQVLGATGGDRRKAARRLGVSLATLYRKLGDEG